MRSLTSKVGLAAAALLLLAACGGASDTSNTTEQQTDLVEATPTVAASGEVGTAIDLGDGVKVRMYDLAGFTPPVNTSNYTKGDRAMTFMFEIDNGSKADVDPAALAVTSKATADCVDIFNADIGIAGPPAEAVKPGTKSTFKWAIACPGKSGDEVKIQATFDGAKYVEIIGKLP